MTSIITTLGTKSAAELGMILPHEHVFVDLRTWDTPGYAQAEPDFALHLEMAHRGAWLEYDSIGNEEWVREETILENILRLLEAGLGDQLLLSHDRGWYDPALPGGGVPKPFTYLTEQFLPGLRAAGVDEATIRQLTQVNPFRAFAR